MKENKSDEEIQALSLLFTESGNSSDRSSERQFTITTGIVTLHVLALAGLILHSEKIECIHRVLGGIAFLVLDVLNCFRSYALTSNVKL